MGRHLFGRTRLSCSDDVCVSRSFKASPSLLQMIPCNVSNKGFLGSFELSLKEEGTGDERGDDDKDEQVDEALESTQFKSSCKPAISGANMCSLADSSGSDSLFCGVILLC